MSNPINPLATIRRNLLRRLESSKDTAAELRIVPHRARHDGIQSALKFALRLVDDAMQQKPVLMACAECSAPMLTSNPRRRFCRKACKEKSNARMRSKNREYANYAS